MQDVSGGMVMDRKSHIGNFYDQLKSYSSASERSYSYLNGKWADFEQWKVMARAKVFELLHYFPEEAPLDPAVLKITDKGYYTQEEVEFNTAKDVRIKGTMLIPKGKGPFPAVVAIHDHGGFYYYGREKIIEQDNENRVLREFKERCYGGRSWANQLVKRGFVTLTIDGFYFGSRRADIDAIADKVLERSPYNPLKYEKGCEEYIEEFNRFCGWFEGLLVKHIFYSGATWPGILFHDDRKSVDYLLTRKEVDGERIGCCGLSIGGFRSAHLAALDGRIKCAVVAGWMPAMDSLLYDRLLDHTYMVYIPGLSRFMDLPDVAGLIAPNYLFVQQCSHDPLYNLEGMQEACSHIERIYEKAGFGQNYKYKFYDNGHEFNIQMQEDAFEWLEEHLKAR